jgi:beta-glucosidase
MPGTNKWRSIDLVTRTIRSRKLLPRTLKECAKNVLRLVQACAAGAPEVSAPMIAQSTDSGINSSGYRW